MEQQNNTAAKPTSRTWRSSALSQSSNPKSQPHNQPHNWLKHNTGPEITSITKNDLQPDPAPVDSSSDHEVLCSYNWQNTGTPTIHVPGAPPRWTPPKLPVTLSQDKGGRFIDQNAHRCPEYPFEPLFQAIRIMKPDADFSQVDLIANRNSLRKLLDFVSGKVWDSFRIELDMVHDTLVITRRERRTKENASGQRGNLGFGTNFEHSFTVQQKGLENSSGHHRVTKYKLGDLECVVRYEVDAFLAEDEDENEDEKQKVDPVSLPAENTQLQEDDLLASLKGLSLQNKEDDKKAKGPKLKGVQVVPGGTEVAATRLLELKTKSKPPVMSLLVPQLWFGRVPFLIVGVHDNGTFHKLSVRDTSEEFLKFEKLQQDRLRKLVHLIKLLKEYTVSSPEKACVVVCEPKIKPVKLSILKVKNKKAVLPAELIKSRWGSKGT